MAHVSRRIRKERRLRHRLNQTNRANRKIGTEAQKTFAVLMAVLAQSGGDVTVTKGTLDQVSPNLLRLGYVMVAGAAPNEFIVRQLEEDVTAHVDNEPTPETEGEPAPTPVETLPETNDPAANDECGCGEDDCLTCNPSKVTA